MQQVSNPLFQYIIDNAPDGKYSKTTHWLACKCPYCDSESQKRHFSIQLKDGQPLIYLCFRATCGASGVLNKKVARELGLGNVTFLRLIQDEFMQHKTVDASKKSFLKELDTATLGTLSPEAKEYFKKRTGKDLTKEFQKKFRVCSSMTDFINENKDNPRLNIENLSLFRNRELRGDQFIYFFNERFTMVYARQINGDFKMKSSTVKSKSMLTNHVPYTFKGDGAFPFNESTAENTLFLAEGIFDIINAYLHVYGNYRGIFMMSAGMKYTTKCLQMMSKYYFKPDIVILSDSDVPLHYYTQIMSKRVKFNRMNDIYVVYNKEDKDLGDYKGRPYVLEVTKIKKGKENE